MMNSKKLTEVARKLQRVASLGRKASSAHSETQHSSSTCSASSVADKGNFIAYTLEGKRFMVPLAYLGSRVFAQLLNMAEEEFGLPSDGPITLPCDARSMERILSLLRKRGSKAFDNLVLDAVFKQHGSPCSSHLVGFSTQQAVCSF